MEKVKWSSKFENHCAVAVPECNDTDARLVHGTSPREGVVEICFGGRWGSVCNKAWDKADAAVVCGQLGFSREGEARIYSSTFTPGYKSEGRNIFGMRLYFVQLRLTMPYVHIFFIIHVYVNRFVCRCGCTLNCSSTYNFPSSVATLELYL